MSGLWADLNMDLGLRNRCVHACVCACVCVCVCVCEFCVCVNFVCVYVCVMISLSSPWLANMAVGGHLLPQCIVIPESFEIMGSMRTTEFRRNVCTKRNVRLMMTSQF